MELWKEIEELKKAETFPQNKEFKNMTFVQYLENCKQRHPREAKSIRKNTLIDANYLYQITSGIRNPGKDKVLQIALALHLKTEETNILLALSKNPMLLPSQTRDAIFIFALEHELSLEETNNLLLNHSLSLLF
ncbi:MAG: hypothetical protein Q4C49_06135 [Bacillota bacterium]|nr:hypothetical protein [Bacillota bacterium]